MRKEPGSYQRVAVGPAEVAVVHLIVQADPLVVLAQTCDAGAERDRELG